MARRSKHLSPAVRRDSLILIQANEEDATKLQGVLDLYECSGQIINKDKSTIMFSKNIGSEHKVAVMRTMGINREFSVINIWVYQFMWAAPKHSFWLPKG